MSADASADALAIISPDLYEPGFFRSVGIGQNIACMVVEDASRTKQRELTEIPVGR